jgi:hypothetical protein
MCTSGKRLKRHMCENAFYKTYLRLLKDLLLADRQGSAAETNFV